MTAGQQFRLIACPSISHERRHDTYFAPGRTVGDYLNELGWKTDGLSARVFIDGQLIPDAEWLDAKPAAGQSVIVRRVFTGGNTGKQIGMLAILALAPFAAPTLASVASILGASGGTFGGILGVSGVISAGLGIAGILALNGLIPPALPRRRALPTRELKEAA